MSIFWRVLINRLKSDGHEIICLIPPGDSDSEQILLSYGARIINYPLNRKGLNPLQDFNSYLKLGDVFASEKPDLLFAATIKPVIYGLLAAHKNNIPATFAAITGLGYTFERNNLFKKLINKISIKLYRAALAYANGIFFQNKADKELFIQNNIIKDDERLCMTRGTGVDIDYFKPEAMPDIHTPGELKFLFIGRLLEAKGLFEYEQAAAILKKDWPDAKFQILGPMEQGPGSISPEQLEKWRTDGNIEYLGSTRDVRPYIKDAHVMVLPSWREGTPTAIMEAMSMQRPCVVSNAPGCTEVVLDGENGFLCKVKDARSLAENMEKFLLNPELLSSMGEKSRSLAVSVFDANKVADGIIQDMQKLAPADIWKENLNDKRI